MIRKLYDRVIGLPRTRAIWWLALVSFEKLIANSAGRDDRADGVIGPGRRSALRSFAPFPPSWAGWPATRSAISSTTPLGLGSSSFTAMPANSKSSAGPMPNTVPDRGDGGPDAFHKVITIASGVFSLDLIVFVVACCWPRRGFGIEAALLWKFGEPIRNSLRNGKILSIVFVVLLFGGFALIKLL